MKSTKRLAAFVLALLFAIGGSSVTTFASETKTEVPLWVTFFRSYQRFQNRDAVNKTTPTYGCSEQDDINYEGDGDDYHLLDVYSPGGVPANQKLPVIVEVHGGAYTTCQKEINRCHGMYLASLGFRVVNINYTLVPEGTIAQEMQEISDVFSWIQRNQEIYGLDGEHIFLTGDSSGGHLVLLFAAAQNAPDLQENLGIHASKGFRAVAATCPVGSFTANDVRSQGMHILLKYGTDFDSRNDPALLSYENFLRKTQPPTFLITSSGDKTAYPVTRAIHEFMTNNGIAHEYREYSNGTPNTLDHVFNVLKIDLPESRQANGDIAAFFLQHMA